MSQHATFPAERELYHEAASHSEYGDVYEGIDTPSSRIASGPPPSYMDTVAALVDLDTKDTKEKRTGDVRDMSLGDSPTQLPFDDLVVGSSSRPSRRSLPVPSLSRASPDVEHQPYEPPQQPPHQPSHEPPQHLAHARLRPELPHAPRSAPDPRGRVRLEHIDELEEMNPFGHHFHEEGPFEAGRRAQRVADAPTNDSASPKGHAYVNGRVPSVKPGEIMPGHTMRPPNGMPAFFPPLEAPPFPPTIHAPIRPAHFPPELHPRVPPSPPQPTRSNSNRHPPHPPPPPPSQPTRSHSHHPLPPPPPQHILSHTHHPQPPPSDPLLARAHSHRHPPPAHFPSQPPYPSAPPPTRRHTYDMRDGVPPGLAPNGRYPAPAPAPAPGVPLQPHQSPIPHPQPNGYPYPYGQPQPYPPGPPSRTPSQHQYQHPPQPGRSILKDPQRHSLPAPAHSPLSTPGPMPVRLPSQNAPTPTASTPSTPHSLALNGIIHTPPFPSGSPRADPSRPPRPTPKPVMPQLLAPLAFGQGGPGQLQRSASSAPMFGEKSGLLSKTRSILRKRNSSSGIKTHADGAISFAPQPGSAKRYENQALPSMKEEGGGGTKLGKRLSKRK